MGMSKDRLAASAGVAAVAVALSLAALKFWALQATGSLTVAASLADSAIDAVASMTGLAAILYASKPADDDHAFGHASAEDLAALGQSALILVSAAAIAWRAVARLADPAPAALEAEGFGMAIMGVSVALTLGLLFWQRHVARVTGSRVVAADALHYVSDLLPNLGAIAALAASRWYDLPWVDSVLGLVAAAILARGAAKIARGAWDALMDRGADKATLARLHDIAAHHPGMHGYHDLKTRTSGRRLFVQIHVELDGALSLREAHDIGAGLRHKMLDAFPDAEVIVHKDPA
ncbi:MAG: cation diffusion facilitator family transporter [Pseudomonadota bacterium]|nr:cation diffusion facilitator family transporter [Pseudomonadota bacterium]MEE3102061.1 cation diffusion facilitator family transporter [Pseudomonadota bacterium]